MLIKAKTMLNDIKVRKSMYVIFDFYITFLCFQVSQDSSSWRYHQVLLVLQERCAHCDDRQVPERSYGCPQAAHHINMIIWCSIFLWIRILASHDSILFFSYFSLIFLTFYPHSLPTKALSLISLLNLFTVLGSTSS